MQLPNLRRVTHIPRINIVNEGRVFVGNVIFDNQRIIEVNEGEDYSFKGHIDSVWTASEEEYLLPGAIDTHVHFREPGLTSKASIATETAQGLRGGVTSFIDMPNTIPPTTTIEALAGKMDIASLKSLLNYGFFIGATADNLDTILSIPADVIPGVKLFLGSSTGNMLMDNARALERLFSSYRGVIAVHAEDEATVRANLAAARKAFGDGEAPRSIHSAIRSEEACAKATQLAIDLALRHNARLHILHVSTAREVEMVRRAKAVAGSRITAETCPHYLYFKDTDQDGPQGWRYKCNPALKTEADRRALLEAVADGTIDTIGSDHAPHLRADKEKPLFEAPSGMPGIRYMLPAVAALAIGPDSVMPLWRVAELTAHNPARIYGIERRGFIREGYAADFVLLAPDAAPRKIADADVSKGIDPARCAPYDWTPYQGLALPVSIKSTFINGFPSCVDDFITTYRLHSEPLRFNSLHNP